MSVSPKLACPSCGVEFISAHGRGLHDEDGNFVEHRGGCRCAYCDWVWFDDSYPVKCVCGIKVRVVCDDEYAYAQECRE